MSIENKLSYLNETKEQIKTALHAPNDIFREYPTLIEKYVKNQPKSIVEGEQAICENAIDLPCNVDINGNAYQETTEGYNLLPYPYSDTAVSLNGLTISSNNNGTLLLNGTSTGTVNFYFRRGSDSWELEKGKYTFSINNNHNKITRIVGGNTSNIAYTYSTQDNMEFEVVNGGSVENSVVIQIGSGVTFNNTILEPMIRKTTVTDTTYEPYTNGASPNTEYKQDIEVIDTVNIFNGELEDGSLLNGANSDNFESARTKDFMKIEPNEDYNFSVNGVLNRVVVSLYDKDKKFIYTGGENGLVSENGLFTTYSNAQYLKFRCYNADKSLFKTGKIQLAKGKELKPYLPYGHIGLVQQNKNIWKQEIMLRPSASSAGILVEKDYIRVNSTGTWANGWIFIKNPKKNTQMSVSALFEEVQLSSLKQLGVYGVVSEVDRQYTLLGQDEARTLGIGDKQLFSAEFNTGDYEELLIRFWGNFTNTVLTGTSSLYARNIQLEYGKPTEYEEHKEIVHEIDLAGNSIAKVGEIKDLLNIGVDGSVSIEKKTNKQILNGEEVYSAEKSAGYMRFNLSILDLLNIQARNTNIKSNYFKSSIDNGYSVIMAYESRAMFYATSDIDTLEKFQALVKEKYDSGNPIEIMYVIKEESIKTIELPSIEPITLFEGTNVFELVTNLGTTMKVEYILNAEKVGG